MQNDELLRFEIHKGIFVAVKVEGNWMALPAEKLRKVFDTADIFEAMEKETKAASEERNQHVALIEGDEG